MRVFKYNIVAMMEKYEIRGASNIKPNSQILDDDNVHLLSMESIYMVYFILSVEASNQISPKR